jgi:hypothetical protein
MSPVVYLNSHHVIMQSPCRSNLCNFTPMPICIQSFGGKEGKHGKIQAENTEFKQEITGLQNRLEEPMSVIRFRPNLVLRGGKPQVIWLASPPMQLTLSLNGEVERFTMNRGREKLREQEKAFNPFLDPRSLKASRDRRSALVIIKLIR